MHQCRPHEKLKDDIEMYKQKLSKAQTISTTNTLRYSKLIKLGFYVYMSYDFNTN